MTRSFCRSCQEIPVLLSEIWSDFLASLEGDLMGNSTRQALHFRLALGFGKSVRKTSLKGSLLCQWLRCSHFSLCCCSWRMQLEEMVPFQFSDHQQHFAFPWWVWGTSQRFAFTLPFVANQSTEFPFHHLQFVFDQIDAPLKWRLSYALCAPSLFYHKIPVCRFWCHGTFICFHITAIQPWKIDAVSVRVSKTFEQASIAFRNKQAFRLTESHKQR